jgi:hypothetical protein
MGRLGVSDRCYAADLANNLATPALSDARQKRETSPRASRLTAKDGSRVGAGFVARTIPSGGHPEQGGAVMHEEAIPMLRVGEAAVSSESTPTISQSPQRRA